MSNNPADNFVPDSRKQVAETYLEVFHLIDARVSPLLGKVTTRALVQGAARRVALQYPFLHFLERMPYTEVVPAVAREQFSGVTPQELRAGLDQLLQECFAGLQELTGDLIASPLHDEVDRHFKQNTAQE